MSEAQVVFEIEARIGVADEPVEVRHAIEQPCHSWLRIAVHRLRMLRSQRRPAPRVGREPRFEIAQTLRNQERWLNRGTVFGNRLIISVERRNSVHTSFGTAEHGITRGCKPSNFMGGEGSSKRHEVRYCLRGTKVSLIWLLSSPALFCL